MIIILSNRLVSFLRFLQPKLVILLFFIICYSCQSENENETQIDAIPVEISLDRFDLKFYNQPASVIPNLKSQYPFLFPKQFSDSIWISRQTDSLQLLLQNEVNKTFESTDLIESELSHLFKHIKFYFPSTVVPKVITLTNNVDYQIKTVYLDSLILLSLDTFLGSDNSLYDGIPNYIRKELDPKYIKVQVADKFASFIIP